MFSLIINSLASPPAVQLSGLLGLLHRERRRMFSGKGHPAEVPGECRTSESSRPLTSGDCAGMGRGCAGREQMQKPEAEKPGR